MTINSSYSRTTYKRKILQLQNCSTKDSCTFLSYKQFNDTDYLKHLRLLSSQYLQLSLYHSIYRTFFFLLRTERRPLEKFALLFQTVVNCYSFSWNAFMKVQPLLHSERKKYLSSCFFSLIWILLLNVSLYRACSNR